MRYRDTKFTSLLRSFGGIKILISPDFLGAVIVALIITALAYHYNLVTILLNSTNTVYVTISAAMIALVIAVLSIIVSLADKDFIYILRKKNTYGKLLFLFWYITVIAGISVVINVLTFIALQAKLDMGWLNIPLLFFTTLFTLYVVFAVLQSIGTLIRVGLYRAEYDYQSRR